VLLLLTSTAPDANFLAAVIRHSINRTPVTLVAFISHDLSTDTTVSVIMSSPPMCSVSELQCAEAARDYRLLRNDGEPSPQEEGTLRNGGYHGRVQRLERRDTNQARRSWLRHRPTSSSVYGRSPLPWLSACRHTMPSENHAGVVYLMCETEGVSSLRKFS
jgi:hypothetical protein